MQRISVSTAPIDGSAVHVVLASDTKFLPFCATAITSVIQNSDKRDKLLFYVLCDALPHADDLTKFQKITEGTQSTVRFLPADAESFAGLRTNKGISAATYYRLCITELLDVSVERVIYIDCDLIVLGRIKDLYCIDMQGNAIVGVEDGSSAALILSTNQRSDTKHVNGGVLVLDLRRMREIDFPRLVADYVRPRSYTIHMGDQQILCGALQGQIGYVGAEWNLHGSMHMDSWRQVSAGYSNSYSVHELEKAAQAPKIIHYTSSRKPWQKGNVHPKAKVYMDYLGKTPYGEQHRLGEDSDRITVSNSPSIRVIHDTIHNTVLMKAYHEQQKSSAIDLLGLLEAHGDFAKIATNVYIQDLSNGLAENHKILFKTNSIVIPTQDDDWEEAAFSALVRWKNSEPVQLRILLNAVRRRKPVLFVETSFFAGFASWAEKSLHPFLRRPLGFIIDDLTFYFDATIPSRMELTLNDDNYQLKPDERLRASALIDRIVAKRITKYNVLREEEPEISWPDDHSSNYVLVVDQGEGDASIDLGLASQASFAIMLKAAIVENPGKTILVKVHPDTVAAGRRGNFPLKGYPSNVVFLSKPVSPHVILDKAEKVYVVSSQLGFEALLRGKEVITFGAPFYAGWGLTSDRILIPRRTAKRSIEDVFHAACLKFSIYIDPMTGEWCSMERCLDIIEQMREDRGPDLAKPVISSLNVNPVLKDMFTHKLFSRLISPFYVPASRQRMLDDPDKFYRLAKHPFVRKIGSIIVIRAARRARGKTDASELR